MPYFKIDEEVFDREGNMIRPGDILQHAPPDPNYPWRYFVCFTSDGDDAEIRDLNANNVYMCDLGPEGDVVNIGHITKVYKQMGDDWNDDDWQHYFGYVRPGADYSYYPCLKDLEYRATIQKLNNFPDNFEAEPFEEKED